jgi:hypothetical protein
MNGAGMDRHAEPYWLWWERMTAEVEQVVDVEHAGPRGEIPARPALAQREEADPRTNAGQGGGPPDTLHQEFGQNSPEQGAVCMTPPYHRAEATEGQG